MRNGNCNISKIFKFYSRYFFAIIFVINNVSSIEAENPLVEVEAFPNTAPIELTVEQEYKLKKLVNN